MKLVVLSLVTAALGLVAGCVASLAQGVDPDFKPELVGADFTSRQVRPGEPFAMTLKFRNAGTKPARGDYWVFVHFEAPTASCKDIVFQADHAPQEPTSLWQPGQMILDGPQILLAPNDQPERSYFVHVGVFDSGGTGERILDSYAAGKIEVTSKAPPSDSMAPGTLTEAEIAQRRAALAARIAARERVGVEAPRWRFDLDRTCGAWALTDKATGVLWSSDPARPRFGHVVLRNGERTASWPLDRFEEIHTAGDHLQLITRPVIGGQPSGVTLTFTLERVTAPEGLGIRYEAQATGPWKVARVRVLEEALGVTEADGGRVYVPERIGIELAADKGLPGNRDWLTYDGLSMAMCGAVKQGSALLVNWADVDTRLQVSTSWPDLPLVAGRRLRTVSVEISAPRAAISLHPLGKGDYVQIAQAYRECARAKGWLKTWAQKRLEYPTTDRMFGACDFKPFVFSRVVPTSRFSSDGKEHTWLGMTFEEAAQCAEHWRNDLDIDRAFVVLAGWINGGYDVRHPDPLPAAPECGGNPGLQQAARRIKACGYLFGLHDNYQDMYPDAPSFDNKWLNKDARGRPKMGGNWAGGQAWQVCAIEQVALASRPDTNLPMIAQLFGPTIYFCDTVFAWGLVTCEDPGHPMTRRDDLEWKSKLCLLCKRYMGLFGSEEGREWAVPCADYLEGIFGHLTDSPPGTVIPLFPLVYRDCVEIMTHQGNRIMPGDEKKIADHILYAQMQLPSFGEHLYWKNAEPEGVGITPLSPVVKDLGQRKFAITYRWRVDKPVTQDLSVFVHFTHASATRAEAIAYQGDHAPQVPTSRWQPGTVVADGPWTVDVPKEFNGPADVKLGMLAGGERVGLANLRSEGGRYRVGVVTAADAGISFEPVAAESSQSLWTRGDGGWGEKLCATDRLIKNVWEVLSPLNVITAERPLASHEFLTPDRLLQRTRMGDLTVTCAYEKPAKIGEAEVPAYGFVVDSPRFIAFCATKYNGLSYATPTLFTARSLDGRPLAGSRRVRVYHGFGDKRLRLGGKDFEVEREATVSVVPQP